MVTDRRIIVSNGNTSIELTARPFTVQETKGFDRLNVQLVTSQGFDQDGAHLLNDYVIPRDMEIKGQLKADTTQQMQNFRDKLFNLFIPHTDITINHYYGGKNRLIVARVEKTPQFEYTEVSKVNSYSVELTATEPYWRDVNETLVQIANTIGGFYFPLVIPKDKGVSFGIKSANLIANVHNNSSIKVGMKIVFIAKGAVCNPQLFDVKTRKFIRLLCEMEAGEQITIQTGQDKTVERKLNGLSQNYIGKIDLAGGGSTFLELQPGDNLLRYGADSGEDMLETKIYFRNKYSGV